MSGKRVFVIARNVPIKGGGAHSEWILCRQKKVFNSRSFILGVIHLPISAIFSWRLYNYLENTAAIDEPGTGRSQSVTFGCLSNIVPPERTNRDPSHRKPWSLKPHPRNVNFHVQQLRVGGLSRPPGPVVGVEHPSILRAASKCSLGGSKQYRQMSEIIFAHSFAPLRGFPSSLPPQQFSALSLLLTPTLTIDPSFCYLVSERRPHSTITTTTTTTGVVSDPLL